MSENGNTDDAVQPRNRVLYTPLLPTEVGIPEQYMRAEAAIPAEPLEPGQPAQYFAAEQGIPAEPLEPREYMRAMPLEPEQPLQPREYYPASPRYLLDDPEYAEEEPAQPLEYGERVQGRLLGATRSPETPRYRTLAADEQQEPRAYRSVRPESVGEPRVYRSTGPDDSKPAMRDREKAVQAPPAGGHDNGGGGDNGGDNNPPRGSDNPPPGTDDSSSTPRGGGSVFVDTQKLTQAIPGLDGIMRQMYAIGNGTANALSAYQLNRGDSYGEAYCTTADPISAQILDGLSSAGRVFGDTAEGAGLMVHNYNVTEENAVNSAGDLLSRPNKA